MAKYIPGIYEQVINQLIDNTLSELDRDLIEVKKDKIDSAESSKILTDYLSEILKQVFNFLDVQETVITDRVALCNGILEYIIDAIENEKFSLKKDRVSIDRVKSFLVHQDAELLLAILDKKNTPGSMFNVNNTIKPVTSIAINSLFTGAKYEPNLDLEIKKEILTCNSIDFLVSFIKWSGLRLLLPELKLFTQKGGKLRVISTAYMGATECKAIEELAKLANTEVKISYDTKHTRLHAKAFTFWRDTGFSTAYIGSSNISAPAMTSGLEWNMKVSEYESKEIFDKIEASFNTYWNNPEFVTFDLTNDADKLQKALYEERKPGNKQTASFLFDIRPFYYQQEILDKLKAEREIHKHYKNLIVAATGTGKTVISAFDYLNFCKENPKSPNRLLFVAHRKEILEQSLQCFRGILKDLNFGSLMVDGSKPKSIDHLFVSIQSFNSKDLVDNTTSDFYDYIVIDEFHHAAAPSYQELLNYYKPKILLGLTATPERADGKSIFPYFDNRIAAEIRLYEAIDKELLSPFHYFGVTDPVDLRDLRFIGDKYDEHELENVYVFSEAAAKKRVQYIIEAVKHYCASISDCIGIGFCVTKKHAEFMSKMFNEAGIPSEFLISESSDEVRDTVKKRLVTKEINFVFVVDIYNEGVDIPEVNTVLFLRPTESLTVFLQQLGRGLRLSQGKDVLTVLDFIGQAHKQYSFETRFKALLSKTRKTVENEIKSGFVNVPKGCSIQLEKQAQEFILENIKNTINNKTNIINKLKDQLDIDKDLNAFKFYTNYHIQPQDVYGKKYTLSGLAIGSGLIKGQVLNTQRNNLMARSFGRLSGANSRTFLEFLFEILPLVKESKGAILLNLTKKERTMLTMFFYTLWGKGLDDLNQRFSSMEAGIYWAIDDSLLYNELIDLLRYQYEKIDFVDKPLKLGFETPLNLYCAYTLDQILVALGKHTESKRAHFQEGVLYLSDKDLDVFFVTLNKSEKDYSPTTMYKDYSINDELFHWQSQSRTTVESPTGLRYINQHTNKTNVLFFVREYKEESGITSPYTCLGLADYISHSGSAPINIIWKMENPLPAFVMQKTAKI